MMEIVSLTQCQTPSIMNAVRLPILSFLYQTTDEQTVGGAVVGLPVLPKLLQTKCLPVQGLGVFLALF